MNRPTDTDTVTEFETSTLTWRKSSYSGANGNCVEMAVPSTEQIAVRDSKDPNGPALAFSNEAWAVFVAAAGSGAFPAA